MPADHLDDDALSAAIDGIDLPAPASAHLDSCPSCQARAARLVDAVRLVVTPVPPLEPSAVDAMIDRAMAAPVVPIGERREQRRLLRTMPPPWVVAVAAAVALVVGVPALLRTTERRTDMAAVSDGRSSALSESTGAGSAAGGVDSTTGASTGDYLGALDSDEAVVASLRARLDTAPSEPQIVAHPTADALSEGSGATGGAPAAAKSQQRTVAAPQIEFQEDSAGPPVPTCKAEAKAAANATSGGAEPIYLAPATWQGSAAMVFVFTVAQPVGDGLRRQAYVMAVPGCAVAASPRF